MLALIPQSGDFSGAALGVRSVALLQVPKPASRFFYTKGILRIYKRQVYIEKTQKIFVHIKIIHYLCADYVIFSTQNISDNVIFDNKNAADNVNYYA